MAFTDIEKVKIVTDLCYPALATVPDSIHYTNWIDDRLTNLGTAIESCVRDLLKRLKDMDAKLEKAVCRVGVSRVDNVTFNKDEIMILRRERRRILNELAAMLDIPNKCGGAMGNVCV